MQYMFILPGIAQEIDYDIIHTASLSLTSPTEGKVICSVGRIALSGMSSLKSSAILRSLVSPEVYSEVQAGAIGGQFLLTSPDPGVVDPGQEGLAGFRLRQLLQHRQKGLLCPFEVHAPPGKETTVPLHRNTTTPARAATQLIAGKH
ncbi:hypothetical protein E2C01_013286 [Portunus trituberculatus]|uniref:Uncharacterized protein n=1 Tax=Portunus trituberculatus TaxID=210409 RepID=A0A5B7DGL9_PORTR|nr:hypothetical protein [Portunus trituberculatus]